MECKMDVSSFHDSTEFNKCANVASRLDENYEEDKEVLGRMRIFTAVYKP